MRFMALFRAGRRESEIDHVVAAYSAWRRECEAVHAAYRRWARAGTSDARSAFATYRSALDREEWAADTYARLLAHTRPRPDLDMARQLAELSILFGVI
jgi:hypothetical protein